MHPIGTMTRCALRCALRFSMVALVLTTVSGCAALGRMAVNRVGDSLSSGTSTFSSDEDPELILAAIPFGLKTYESLLAVSPRHRGLLLSTASGFAAYGFLLQQQAQLDSHLDYADRHRLDERVSQLYLRASGYALRGLELDHADFETQFAGGPGRRACATAQGRRAVPVLGRHRPRRRRQRRER